MNIEQARFYMIEQQIRPWDVLETDILDLLTVVKREAFVPEEHKALAFVDTEIPLPCGENMLAPKFEARILQDANITKHDHILEIGAGSGYMAALLSYRGRHVTTVEIEPELKALAEKNLRDFGIANVDVVLGNGAAGWPANDDSGQYDVIVLSGSVPVLPDAFLKQIKIGGRIMAVVGKHPAMSAVMVTRLGQAEYSTLKLFETSIKPLRHVTAPSTFKF